MKFCPNLTSNIDYHIGGVYVSELNPDNPLSTGGALAKSYGDLLKNLFQPSSALPPSSYAPRDFKHRISTHAPQFSGYMQHDSQELLAFLLDGLHEDLNRVLKKPYVERLEWKDGGGNKELWELARGSWEGYKKRNDSVIVDLFQGQYRSTLVCPECEKVRRHGLGSYDGDVVDYFSSKFWVIRYRSRSIHSCILRYLYLSRRRGLTTSFISHGTWISRTLRLVFVSLLELQLYLMLQIPSFAGALHNTQCHIIDSSGAAC